MAAPQISEAIVKSETQIRLVFDQALDNTIAVPVTCFQVNYGKVPVTDRKYVDTNEILLTLGKNLVPGDKSFINYTPPEDINLALRAPTKPNASQATLRRNAVRAVFKYPVRNLLKINEAASGWDADANLGKYASGQGYSRRDRGGDPRCATVDDFILAFGLKEAIQVTNIDDADAIEPNEVRLMMAIQDATALIDSYINQSTKAGKLLVSSNRRRTSLIIARYYLDSVRRREDVLKDYERCIKELEAATTYNPAVRPDGELAINSQAGLLRSWRIPQYYNGVSGKGLSGWWTDTAGDMVRDYRYDLYNAEVNNDDANWDNTPVNEGRVPEQPADDGAEIVSGNSQSS